MRAQRITPSNFRREKKKNVSTLYVDAEAYNELISDVETVTDQIFDGNIDLSKNLTHYALLTLTTDMDIAVKPYPAPKIGGYAEASLIGDGSHTPAFSTALIPTPGSNDYDSALGILNKIGFYYDGTYIFYTITAFSS